GQYRPSHATTASARPPAYVGCFGLERHGGDVDPVPLGIVFGVGLALFDLVTLYRLHWPDRRHQLAAPTAAVNEAFMIGLLSPPTDLGTPRWVSGVIIGLALSLPSAILTKAYQPIIGVGLVAGLALGIAAQILL